MRFIVPLIIFNASFLTSPNPSLLKRSTLQAFVSLRYSTSPFSSASHMNHSSSASSVPSSHVRRRQHPPPLFGNRARKPRQSADPLGLCPSVGIYFSTRRSSRFKKETPVGRRSSRLKNATPVTYFEGAEEKKGKACKKEIVWLGEGERPEIYTDEHEKLLGDTERAWELFVDGYDKDGKRIYDPVTGKSCHLCRQKTLGYRTQCSRCHPSVAGQFCGDCLYMRYGEHVFEAMENPDWICPCCRGIYNCSFCRKHKGWLPTGAAYRKICKLGYKSVAHYLIQTNKQSETSDDGETDDERSLSLKEAKVSSEEDDGLEDDSIDDNLDDDEEGVNKNPDSAQENQTSMIDDVVVGDVKPLDVNEMDPATPVIIDVEDYYAKKEKKGETSRSKRKISVEPNPNSIGGRLRQRRKCQASLMG